MNLPVGVPLIMTIGQLAERLGVSHSTVYAWVSTDPKWRGCVARASKRKIWMSVPRLIDNGLLPRPEPPPVTPMPGLSFTYETKTRVS